VIFCGAFWLRSWDCSLLAMHRVTEMNKHPDGPGALAFYDLSGAGDPRGFRAVLLREVSAQWPRDIFVDEVRVRLGVAGADGIDEEFVQYNSCAAGRVLEFIVTGSIPGHLVRNSELRRSLQDFRDQVRQAIKRPAAPPRKRPAAAW
jgi:hypothetical protein